MINACQVSGESEPRYCVRDIENGDPAMDEWMTCQKAHSDKFPVAWEWVDIKDGDTYLEERFQHDRRRPRNVLNIHYSNRTMHPWYYSPIHVTGLIPPSECNPLWRDIWICCLCLRPFASHFEHTRHSSRCVLEIGEVIYHDPIKKLKVYFVSGEKQRRFCRYLCLLAKFFLEDKWLRYDVDRYEFHCLVAYSETSCVYNDSIECEKGVITSFFSRDKYSLVNNLACIVTFPPYQRLGHASFLVDLSYEPCRRLCLSGTNVFAGPEGPLSPYGKALFFKYWDLVVLREIEKQRNKMTVSLSLICNLTGFSPDTVTDTITRLGIFHRRSFTESAGRELTSESSSCDRAFPTTETLVALLLPKQLVTWLRKQLGHVFFVDPKYIANKDHSFYHVENLKNVVKQKT